MKFKAIIMTPQVVEFECDDNERAMGNAAYAETIHFDSISALDEVYDPRLLLIIKVEPPPEVLVFDPPPQVA